MAKSCFTQVRNVSKQVQMVLRGEPTSLLGGIGALAALTDAQRKQAATPVSRVAACALQNDWLN